MLGPEPGVAPSTKPPVRIFLGTEEAQYRAERIFFFSIEKFRDPARTYEVYLMKNIRGFDRKGWRTGFTKYRFAIPDFAGRQGKAIYNDVDQIYLADPAELFDLDMDGHGYLAISPEETSVMLIDCARMAPIWNRTTANARGKHELIKRPAATPGLWGPCDPHWNARDLEYVEGWTKCLHYTALHQQPWQPFPDSYSYHPNPLAYIWHELEREADAAGYQIFTRERPSPGFHSALGRNRPPAAPGTGADLPSAAAKALATALGAADVLEVTAGGAGTAHRASLADRSVGTLDLRADPAAWPDGPADIVAATGVFDIVPADDIPWVLDELFRRARKLVYVTVPTVARSGLGSAEWWRRRVAEAASRHPGVSWHLDAVGDGGAVQAFQARRVASPGAPRVWALVGESEALDAQVLRLAEATGWPYEIKRLAFNERARLPNALHGATLATLDRERSNRLEAPWPDLVIAGGRRAVPVARWIHAQAGGAARLVQIGRPGASFDLFDLVVALPEQRLPIRDNVLHVTAPLAGLDPAAMERASAAWRERLADLPRPWTAVLVGARWPYLLTVAKAREIGRRLAETAGPAGGSLLIAAAAGASEAAVAALAEAAGRPHRVARAQPGRPDDPRAAFVDLADRLVVSGDDADTLAAACLTGKPVGLVELPTWQDRLVVIRPLLGLLAPIVGGGATYRGTPHQQTIVGRLVDEATAKGLVALPRDLHAVHDALVARGLVTRLGEAGPVARRRPLDDLSRAVERIRRLMTELPAVG